VADARDARGSQLSDPGRSASRKRERRDMTRVVAGIVLVALLVAFVVANTNTVKVHFVLFTANVELIWVLLITALLGGVVGRLLQWKLAKSRREAAREARRK